MHELPRITTINGHPRLVVDGKPFLILGLQWACDSCFAPEEMDSLFPQAAHLNANTAALPTYWREIEPTPGVYDFHMIAERIRMANEHNLRLVLLWFATWKNACSFYAPEYIRNHPETYPLALDRQGKPTVSLCPSSEVTWQRDRDALIALMEYLRDYDVNRRVILVQIENEPGVFGSDRCYCQKCNEQFVSEKWEANYGVHAAEAFSAVSIAGYIDRLAAIVKQIYPIPLYTNVWLASPVNIAGRDYPSGGGVPMMFELFRQHCPHLDMVSPDIYVHSYRDFQRLCHTYGVPGNPLYIAEHSSSLTGRAERNVFYAIGQYAALGFDPWAIDSPFPERYGEPLVDPVNGNWGPQAYWLRDSYFAIGRAIGPIVDTQGTDKLFTFAQEPGEAGTGWSVEGFDVIIVYHNHEGAGRGMVIQRSSKEFILVGVGFDVKFRHSRPSGDPAALVEANWGYFDNNSWVTLHPIAREHLESQGMPIKLIEPGVVQVILE